MASNKIKIISANVRGLRQALKRADLFDYFKGQHADIICLQETHLVQADLNCLIKDWNLKYFIAGTSTNSRGVAILINNTFECVISSETLDPDGRFAIIDLDIANLFTITLANIYAPNSDDSVWYTNLLSRLSKDRENSLIVVGDWNTPLSEFDTYNYTSPRNPKCRQLINDFMSKESMIDIWRLSNKKVKGFTWRSRPRSRLDYFLLSDDLLGLDPKIEYLPAYKSDHNPITMSFIKSRQNRGRGLWKFNNQLLQNQDFIDMVKEEIFLVKSTYALPVYNPEHVKNDKGKDLELLISDTVFLDTLLC